MHGLAWMSTELKTLIVNQKTRESLVQLIAKLEFFIIDNIKNKSYFYVLLINHFILSEISLIDTKY
jgi:hypothetical protein